MVKSHRSIPLKQAKSRAALTITHPNAAGIDIGSAAHFVAVPPDRDDEPVREFPSFTVDLSAIADWLVASRRHRGDGIHGRDNMRPMSSRSGTTSQRAAPSRPISARHSS